MLSFLTNMFSGPDLTEHLDRKAQIIDVRTAQEFAQGHAKGSVNMPLQSLTANLRKLDKSRPVITCCRSGNRSGIAARQLNQAGFEAVNGGSWQQVVKALTNKQ